MGRPGNRPAIAAQGLRLQRAFEAGAVLVAAEQELAVQRVDHVDGIAQHDDDLGVRRKRLDLLGGAPRVEVPDGAFADPAGLPGAGEEVEVRIEIFEAPGVIQVAAEEERLLGIGKEDLGMRSEEHTSELQSLMRISY